jgi:hypothetical protein
MAHFKLLFCFSGVELVNINMGVWSYAVAQKISGEDMRTHIEHQADQLFLERNQSQPLLTE